MRPLGPLGRLRALTAVVFVALALPAGVLVHRAWQDLRWQALHTQRVLAQELLARVDARARALVAAENARPATDYAFLNLAGDPRANFVQRSPLAVFPPPADLPGVVGYFEVDAHGRFGTPLLPPGTDGAPFGVDGAELAQRQALAARLADVLARSRLVRAPVPAVPPAAPPEHATRYAYEADAGGESLRRDSRAAPTPPPARAPESEQEAAADAPAGAGASALVGQAAFDALEARQRGTPEGKWQAKAAPAAQARKERSALPALGALMDAAPAEPAPPSRAAAQPDGSPAGASVAADAIGIAEANRARTAQAREDRRALPALSALTDAAPAEPAPPSPSPSPSPAASAPDGPRAGAAEPSGAATANRDTNRTLAAQAPEQRRALPARGALTGAAPAELAPPSPGAAGGDGPHAGAAGAAGAAEPNRGRSPAEARAAAKAHAQPTPNAGADRTPTFSTPTPATRTPAPATAGARTSTPPPADAHAQRRATARADDAAPAPAGAINGAGAEGHADASADPHTTGRAGAGTGIAPQAQAPASARVAPPSSAPARVPPAPGTTARLAPGGSRPSAADTPPQPAADAGPTPLRPAGTDPVRLFESEVDPHVLGRLESGHFVLYRRVWRDGVRSVQGVLLEPAGLLAGLIGAAYRDSALARSAALEVRFAGTPLAHDAPSSPAGYAGSAPDARAAMLLDAPLAAPFDAFTLRLTAAHLPPAPGAGVVAWTALALGVVLVGGLAALYALGARALALAQAQREFVTGVSHELRTPLTAIRMYGEMLVHGWADEARRGEYHRYIHDEAQRLSRLIESVLSFGRASRGDLRLTLRPATVGELADLLRSRLSGPVQAAGFTLRVDCAPDAAALRVAVDADAFTQVLMNLTDNALKFAAGADRRAVEVSLHADAGRVRIAVRDFGPGLARRDLKRVFRPFYRARAVAGTPGTGIGLALASALAHAMRGHLAARNAAPGAVFTLTLPALGRDAAADHQTA